MKLAASLVERLQQVASELRIARMIGVDPYGRLSAADLELALNNGLLDRQTDEPHQDGE